MNTRASEVLAANAAFYEAINRRDAARMDALWAVDASVACVHPGWAALEGREEVMESWRAILQNPESPRIQCSDASTHIYDKTAFVTCVESIDGNALVATNVFVHERGAWRMVHHHAGPLAQRRPRPRTTRPPPRDLN